MTRISMQPPPPGGRCVRCAGPVDAETEFGWHCDPCIREITKCGHRGPDSTCTCGWHTRRGAGQDLPVRQETHNPSVDEEPGATRQFAGYTGKDITRHEIKKAARRGHVWGWVDNIEVADGDTYLLVLASCGALAIDSQWHATDLTPELLAHDSRKAAHAARRAASILRSQETPLPVRGVLVVWGATAHEFPVAGCQVDGVDIIAGRQLRHWLPQLGPGELTRDRAGVVLTGLRHFRRR